MKSFIFFTHSGCLLPLLIVLNLFFGRIFFKTSHWLLIELGLILLFVLNSVVIGKKFFSASTKRHHPNNVIDVEGEVIKDGGRD